MLKWIGVGNSNHHSANALTGTKTGGVKPINHADYKQFGLENFGNTCYANAVLQALYFCQPFRELVCDAHDKSNPTVPHSLLIPQQSAPIPSPPSRSPGFKGFRRRDIASDGGKPDDALSSSSPLPSTPGAIPISTTPPTLFSALRSLFLHIALNPSDKGTVSPSTFIKKLKEENELYRSSMHQDAHEFLNFLLNKIVEDLEAEMKRNPESGEDLSNSLGSLPAMTSSSSSTGSPSQSHSTSSDSQSNRNPQMTFVHSLFEGTLTSETRCLTCETISSRDESFLDLSIDIEQNSSVTACLRQFSASEMLSHKNKFFCDSCGGLQEAEKRMKIKKLPNVLALHLKRFKYQEDVQKYIKLAYRVAFPFELRLFNTVDDAEDPDRLYRLFAIVVHIGGGPHHGHYIAIVKAHGTWLVFDDDTVEPIRDIDISKYFGESPGGAGYVLFYQAVDLDLASIGIDPTPASTSEGEIVGEGEAESSADSDPLVPATPASIPQATLSPAPLKLDVPVVVEPRPPNVSTPTSGSGSGGFLSNVSFRRTLKHSQSVKVITEKKRTAVPAAFDVDSPPPRTVATTNGIVPPVPVSSPPPPLPLLVHSQSLSGRDKGGGSGWFSTRSKDKKEKRPPLLVPPGLAADDIEHRTTTHEGRRPSAPGQLERGHASSDRGSSSVDQPELHTRSSHSMTASSPSSALSVLVVPTAPSPLPSLPRAAESLSVPRSPSKSTRPSTSPSSLPTSPVNLPPVPPLPSPSSPPTRQRKLSQTLPSPSPQSFPTMEPHSSAPPAAPRPTSVGAKPKRASRKMSLSSVPRGMFGWNHKDKDKERGEAGTGSRTHIMAPPDPAPYTSRSGAV